MFCVGETVGVQDGLELAQQRLRLDAGQAAAVLDHACSARLSPRANNWTSATWATGSPRRVLTLQKVSEVDPELLILTPFPG